MSHAIIILFIISITVSIILIIINSIIAKKNFSEREKPSAFECGFNPINSSRIPFSLRFFLIAIVFLIFDVEITLIFPIPMITYSSNLNSVILLTSFFIIILILGLYHE